MIELDAPSRAPRTAPAWPRDHRILRRGRPGDHVWAWRRSLCFGFLPLRVVEDFAAALTGIHPNSGRRPRPDPWKKEVYAAEHNRLPRQPDHSDARRRDISAIAEIAPPGRPTADRRQRIPATPIWQAALARRRLVVYSSTKHNIDARPLPRRHHFCRRKSVHFGRAHPQFHAPTRPVDVAVNAWVLLKGLETFGRTLLRPHRAETAAKIADALAAPPKFRGCYPCRAIIRRRPC